MMLVPMRMDSSYIIVILSLALKDSIWKSQMSKACYLLCVEGEVALYEYSQIPWPWSMAWPDGQELGIKRTGRSETRRSGFKSMWMDRKCEDFVSHINTQQNVSTMEDTSTPK